LQEFRGQVDIWTLDTELCSFNEMKFACIVSTFLAPALASKYIVIGSFFDNQCTRALNVQLGIAPGDVCTPIACAKTTDKDPETWTAVSCLDSTETDSKLKSFYAGTTYTKALSFSNDKQCKATPNSIDAKWAPTSGCTSLGKNSYKVSKTDTQVVSTSYIGVTDCSGTGADFKTTLNTCAVAGNGSNIVTFESDAARLSVGILLVAGLIATLF
jgi:hypothetical protein